MISTAATAEAASAPYFTALRMSLRPLGMMMLLKNFILRLRGEPDDDRNDHANGQRHRQHPRGSNHSSFQGTPGNPGHEDLDIQRQLLPRPFELHVKVAQAPVIG